MSIKPTSSPVTGDVITHEANSHFDGNAPVLTATAATYAVTGIGVSETEPEKFILWYPNQADEESGFIFCKVEYQTLTWLIFP